MSYLLRVGGTIAVWFSMLNAAAAHPHVLVTARAELILKNNEVTAIQEVWTFDEMYTAFAITGFGKTAKLPTPEELSEVAKQNIDDPFGGQFLHRFARRQRHRRIRKA